MKIFYSYILMGLLFFLVGCSDKTYYVRYNTNPPGANLVCGGKYMGYTPVTLSYNLEDENYWLEKCKAVWISGAEVEFENYIGEVIKVYPNGAEQTQQRPDYPDLDKDMQFALQVEQMKQQQAMQQQQMVMQQRQQLSQKIDEFEREAWEQNRRQQENFDRAANYFKQTDQENYQNQMLYQMQNLNNNLRDLNRSLY